MFAFFLPVLFILQICYCLTLRKTIKEINISNRQIHINAVWITLIPIFGYFWQFYLVTKMTDSLQKEFYFRRIDVKDYKSGYFIGIAFCILFSFFLIPKIGLITSILGFFCWIYYWRKIHNYGNILKENKEYLSNQISEIGKNLV